MLDIVVRRNGYGRQLASFEASIDVPGVEADRYDDGAAGERAPSAHHHRRPMHAIFIRAPRIVDVGPEVRVLARHDGDPVLVRQGAAVAAAFHPELGTDRRLHALFLDIVESTLAPSSG